MNDKIIFQAERTVALLGIGGFIQEHRHNIRQKLFLAWKDSQERIQFLEPALRLAGAALQIGTTLDAYRTTMADLAANLAGEWTRANEKASQYVLLVILDRAVAECVYDKDDWHQMENTVRASLFDPSAIEDDVNHLVRDVLKLETHIIKRTVEITAKLARANHDRHPSDSADHVESGYPVSFHSMTHLASDLVMTGADAPDRSAATEQARTRTSGDPTVLLTALYPLLRPHGIFRASRFERSV
ncbi:MAG: hypothetical protein WC477_07020 [Patescibacteria group bacterium]